MAKERTNSRSKTQNGRGSRRNSTPKEYTGKDVQHKYNDVSWYAKNESILRDCASFSYNAPLGGELDLTTIYGAGKTGYTAKTEGPKSVPGLAVMDFMPTIGVSTDSASPANLAAQNIYTYVRYMNSGAKNYDQADLMLYLLAMDSVYMLWNWGKRVYGYARLYSQKNKYMPRAYAYGDTVNLQNIIENLADFRGRLNQLAAQISSFCVPAVMPLFIRHSWMVSNIYKDADTEKAQQYMFAPRCFYLYQETESPFGGFLKTMDLLRSWDNLRTYDSICHVIKTAVDALAYSEDIGVMSGDILKAYGQDKLFKITPIDPDYTVEPVYNEEVLNQIHNSTIIPLPTDLNKMNVTQNPDTGYLVWNPAFDNRDLTQSKILLNMPWESVTPANTMVGSRLTSIVQKGSDGKLHLAACGSELITNRFMIWMTTGGNFSRFEYGNALFYGGANDTAWLGALIGAISNFDWHPLMPVVLDNATDKTYTIQGLLGDINNYTIIDDYNLAQMHIAALLSEFNVPQIGSF